MGYPVDGWTEGPGLPQSAWRYKWLVGGLVLLGILGASLFSAGQSTLYKGVVHIFVTPEGAAGDPERTVTSHAQFIESPTVSDRAIALTGNRLTRKEFEKRLTVEPSANGDFITVRARDTTPTNAVGLADAVELAYREILSRNGRQQTKRLQRLKACRLALGLSSRRSGSSGELPTVRPWLRRSKPRNVRWKPPQTISRRPPLTRLSLYRPCRTRPQCPMSQYSPNRC